MRPASQRKARLITLLKLLLVIVAVAMVARCAGTSPRSHFEPDSPREGSVQEIYQDVLVTVLLPHLERAVASYYGRAYSVAPYQVKVLSIDRPQGYRTFGFVIEVEVIPYTGPHNSVGVDHITVRVAPGPHIQIERFEHIRSYDSPR